MARRQNFNLEEIRSLVQLGKRLYASDPRTRTLGLLEGLSRLVRAKTSSCVVTSMVHRSPKVITRVVAPRDPGATPTVAADHGRFKSRGRPASHWLRSSLPIGTTGMTATLELHRDRERFTARERALVRGVHRELNDVYEADPLLAIERARRLSPRERQTLECLLAGDGEKQVAIKLQLSTHTVHHYVKALYRHFRVSTRSELLSRCLAGSREGRGD